VSSGYQSDVIADLIKKFDFPYITLNPGASYRGLHDSLVNHNGNEPPMILCQHEKIAVQIAHGYAKVTGKPMIAIVHNIVGLLHSVMAIYYAYIDRAPVFVIGATGPMDEGKRRPWIDWIHTANVQGEAVRNFVKWDYQPGGIDGVADSFARAYSIMMTEPQGPIYMCYDAWLQEAPLEKKIALPPVAATVPTPVSADPAALNEAVQRMLAAEWPVLLAEFVGRSEHGFDDLVELAETLGAPVVDVETRLNFPTAHELNLSLDNEVFRSADVVVSLDVRNWEGPTHEPDWVTRTAKAIYPPDCRWIDIGFASIEISRWATDYQRFPAAVQRILADTAVAIPQLTERCRSAIKGDPQLAARIEARRKKVSAQHHALRAGWAREAREDWDSSPITIPRLVSEVWEAIRGEDWVLTANTLNDWARKLWDFDRGYRHPGKYLGTGTQIGMSIGVALAHKGQGRLVVDFQPDGDLMFDAGALWTAARYQIPMLIVMHNNRAYWNDWGHQISMAHLRGTPVERAHIGMDIVDPAPDFAGLARDMGCYGEGPIENPADIAPALKRAIEQVKRGKPALIDTITRRPKDH
jgi:acetolactate synthase I/II/III large subunit